MVGQVHRIAPEGTSALASLRELLGARDLFTLLLGREVRVRYRQTALGVLWVVLQPLLPALIFAVVFGSFARLPSGGTPYLLFAFSGLVIFGLFSGAASRAGTSFIRDGQLVTKVYFPRVLLPLAAGSAALIDFLVGVGVLLVLGLLLVAAPSLNLVAVPLIALAALALGLGLGVTVAGLSAHLRDFAIAIPFFLQLLLYASPVVYSVELVPELARDLYWLNPLVALIESFRWAVLGTAAPTATELGAAILGGTAAILAGALVYRRASRDLADVI